MYMCAASFPPLRHGTALRKGQALLVGVPIASFSMVLVKVFQCHQYRVAVGLCAGGDWSQESCTSAGGLQGRPLAESPQSCKCAVGLKGLELQVSEPAWVGFQALSCVHTLSRVPARSCLLTCMHISPWLYCFTCTLSICFSVLPVATVISLSFSLCSLGCFAASYFRMSLFIPFDNNNIRTNIQGPKVPALCRYIRKDPSKPACWREKVLTVSLLPGLAEAKGLIVK